MLDSILVIDEGAAFFFLVFFCAVPFTNIIEGTPY